MGQRPTESPESPDDRFAPPSAGEAGPLELGERAPAPKTRATMADDPKAAQPVARKQVAYKRPDGGARTYIMWVFAAIGLGVAVMGGTRLVRGAIEKNPAAAAAPAPAPVVWKSVGAGQDVLVTIEIEPARARNAKLLLDGAPLPSNPALLARGSQHKLTAIADGFEPASIDVVADTAKSVRLSLKPAR